MVYLNVDELLKEKGKTRYWLAKQLQTDYNTVDKMVNKVTAQIRFETIDKLLKIFECDMNTLFTHVPDK